MDPIIQASQPLEEIPGTAPVRVVSSQEEIQKSYTAYLTDESRLAGGKADVLVFANSEKQVVNALVEANASKTPVTVSAGRTGIVGGAVPKGGVLLSLESMNRFLGARWDGERESWCVRVQPGFSLDGLEQILEKRDFKDVLAVLEGKSREETQKFSLESDQWFYPVDPTEKSAHLGGTVATNASGGRSFKYGPTRNYVSHLRVVLADGTVLSMKRGESVSGSEGFVIQKPAGSLFLPIPQHVWPEMKNVAGYFRQSPMDILDYFIGSEGTLGVVTEIELILRKRPAFVLSMVAFFPSEADAVRFVILAREGRSGPKRSVDPAALEYFDAFSLGLLTQKRKQEGSSSSIPPFPESAGAAVYFEEETKEEDLDRLLLEYETLLAGCHASSDQAWCGMDRKELGKMAVFRHALPEVINTIIGQRQKQFPRLHKIGTDFVVPDRHLEDMLRFYRENLDKAGFEYAVFGHIGENHLHVNILPSDENALDRAKVLYQDFAAKAVSFGGTVSGEHGIGKIKKALLSCMYSEKDILEMKRVKQALDPGGVLNRGNLW